MTALSHFMFSCQQFTDWQWESFLCQGPSSPVPLSEERFLPFSHWPQSNQEKFLVVGAQRENHTLHFYELEIWILQTFIAYVCKPNTYPSEPFRVFSGRDEPSESQLTRWDKYCGRLPFRKGKYKWLMTLINFKHRNRNTIWNRIQRGNSPSKFNSGGWKTDWISFLAETLLPT